MIFGILGNGHLLFAMENEIQQVELLVGDLDVIESNRIILHQKELQDITICCLIYKEDLDQNSVKVILSGTDQSFSMMKSGENAWEVSIPRTVFSEEGEYLFYITASDLEGNYLKKVYLSQRILVDKTPPKVSIRFDKQKVYNKKYYQKPRTAILSVKEENLGENGISYQDGMPDHIIIWSHRGSEYVAEISYKRSGRYHPKFVCTDLAGNQSDPIKIAPFIIDLKNPVCKINGIKEGKSYAEEVNPSYFYQDENIDSSSVKIMIKGSKNGVLKTKDFSKTGAMDDKYTITLTACDLSGRKTVVKKHFFINRYGSTYCTSKNTKDFLQKKYHQKGKSLHIYETNVNKLKEQKIVIRKQNQQIIPLLKDQDYKMTVIKNQDGWMEYGYEIYEKNFQKEGFYEIILSSVDMAGNKQDNVAKKIPFIFVIDQTAPQGTISGLEQIRIRRSMQNVTVHAIDDNCLTLAQIYTAENKAGKNKRLIKFLDVGDIQSTTGEEVMISCKKERQYIFLVLEDAAGNQWQSSPVSVLITKDWFTNLSFFHNLVYKQTLQ